MSRVLSSPWALLLTMVVYAQYNWAAEARGGLLLELPAGQNAYQPGQIIVLVQGPEGDETLCGTLAQLVLHTLKHLGVQCFPAQPDAGALDALLASIIGQLSDSSRLALSGRGQRTERPVCDSSPFCRRLFPASGQ